MNGVLQFFGGSVRLMLFSLDNNLSISRTFLILFTSGRRLGHWSAQTLVRLRCPGQSPECSCLKHPAGVQTKWKGVGVLLLRGRSINCECTLVVQEWKTFKDFIAVWSGVTSHLYLIISQRPIWRSLLCIDWKSLIAMAVWIEGLSTPLTATVTSNRLNYNRSKQVVSKDLIQSDVKMWL